MSENENVISELERTERREMFVDIEKGKDASGKNAFLFLIDGCGKVLRLNIVRMASDGHTLKVHTDNIDYKTVFDEAVKRSRSEIYDGTVKRHGSPFKIFMEMMRYIIGGEER